MDNEFIQRLNKLEQDMREHYHNGVSGRQIYYRDIFGQKVFYGSVNSSGVSIKLPDGWTCSKSATGKYTVTHHIGSAAYAVVITPINFAANSDNVVFTVPSPGVSTFTVEFVQSDSPLTYINTDFNFILVYNK